MATPVKPPAKEPATYAINPFRTCDETGRPVPFRFASAKALREVYQKAQEDDAADADRRAMIYGQYNGKSPWDPAKLRALGLADKTNVNWLGLKGQVDARSGVINSLALDTTDLVQLRPPAAELAGPEAEEIARVVAEEFSLMMRTGMKVLPVLATCVRERDLYGLGPLMWPDPVDYAPRALLRGHVKLPEDAPHLSHLNEIIMVEHPLPAAYVFGLFDNTEASAAMGWQMQALRQYVIATFVTGEDTTSQAGDEKGTSVAESIEAKIRENRLFETKQFETLQVISAFVRETSGDRKVSHYMIPAQPGRDTFLLLRHNVYEGMHQCVSWLPCSVTETSAKALRGLASYIGPIEALKNRRLCELSDAAETLTRIHLKMTSSASPDRLTIREQGRYVAFANEVEPTQAPLAPASLSQAAEIVELMTRITTANALGASGPASASDQIFKGADRKTKEEVLLGKEEGAKAEQAQFVLQMLVYDAIFQECFRRAMKIALDPRLRPQYPEVAAFVKRCEARFVDEAKLKSAAAFDVIMCRDLVTGGSGAFASQLADVVSLGGNLDEPGRIAVTHDYIRARMGAERARRYRPIQGRDTMPSDAASHAQLENNDMLELSPALVASDQLHWSHIPTHGQIIAQIKDAVQSGRVDDPERMLRVFQIVSEHIQQHIQLGGMQIGKAEDAKAALRSLRSMRPIQQALTVMVEDQQRQAEAAEEKAQRERQALEEAAQGKENEVKIHKIDSDAQLEARKQDLQHQAALAKVSADAQVAAFRTQQQEQVRRIQARNKLYIDAGVAVGNPPPSTEGLVPPELP